jgi:hypothetical protein
MGEIDVAFARGAGDEEDDLQALDEIATPVTKLFSIFRSWTSTAFCAATP